MEDSFDHGVRTLRSNSRLQQGFFTSVCVSSFVLYRCVPNTAGLLASGPVGPPEFLYPAHNRRISKPNGKIAFKILVAQVAAHTFFSSLELMNENNCNKGKWINTW